MAKNKLDIVFYDVICKVKRKLDKCKQATITDQALNKKVSYKITVKTQILSNKDKNYKLMIITTYYLVQLR